MKLYILTDLDGRIVTRSATPWATPGEYDEKKFKIVIAEVPDEPETMPEPEPAPEPERIDVRDMGEAKEVTLRTASGDRRAVVHEPAALTLTDSQIGRVR